MAAIQYNPNHNKPSKDSSFIINFIRKNRFLAIATIFAVFLYVGFNDIKHLSTETLKIYTNDSSHTFESLKLKDLHIDFNNKEDRQKFVDAANEAFERNPGRLIKAMLPGNGWSNKQPE